MLKNPDDYDDNSNSNSNSNNYDNNNNNNDNIIDGFESNDDKPSPSPSQQQPREKSEGFRYAFYMIDDQRERVVVDDSDEDWSSLEEDDFNKKAKKSQSELNSSKWNAFLDSLKQYKATFGSCLVPRGYEAGQIRLGSWVAEQRKQYKLYQMGRRNSMTPSRIDQLTELGFAWNAQEAVWQQHYENLLHYRQQHGDCLVPASDQQYPKLGLWVKEQRRNYTLMLQGKHSHLSQERIASLERIGFCWDTYEATWQERFKELQQFKARNGHCLVPTRYRCNPKLATWVHHQRRQHKRYISGKSAHINPRRIQALDSIGFVWSKGIHEP